MKMCVCTGRCDKCFIVCTYLKVHSLVTQSFWKPIHEPQHTKFAKCTFLQSDRSLHLPSTGNMKPGLTLKGTEQNEHWSKIFWHYRLCCVHIIRPGLHLLFLQLQNYSRKHNKRPSFTVSILVSSLWSRFPTPTPCCKTLITQFCYFVNTTRNAKRRFATHEERFFKRFSPPYLFHSEKNFFSEKTGKVWY